MNRKADDLLQLLTPSEDSPIDTIAALEKMRRRLPLEGHLSHLLTPAVVDVPWYISIWRNLRDLAFPEKLAPLNVTCHAVPVKDIWERPGRNRRSRWFSVAFHAAALSFLVFGAANKEVATSIRERLTLIDPTLKPFAPETHKTGGGGGGAREQLPVSAGQLPKRSLRQFVPPQIVDRDPLLAMAPTIIAPPDAPLPQQFAANWGDPLATLSTRSNGPGSNGGMGDGDHGGLGPGKGPGYGPGADGGIEGGVFSAGGKVSNPIPIYKVDPEFSEDARKAKLSGSVTVAIIVDSNGRVRNAHVVKSLGLGLDEKAIEAVEQWKFKPGMKDGHPVNVVAHVLVTFHLL